MHRRIKLVITLVLTLAAASVFAQSTGSTSSGKMSPTEFRNMVDQIDKQNQQKFQTKLDNDLNNLSKQNPPLQLTPVPQQTGAQSVAPAVTQQQPAYPQMTSPTGTTQAAPVGSAPGSLPVATGTPAPAGTPAARQTQPTNVYTGFGGGSGSSSGSGTTQQQNSSSGGGWGIRY